MNTVARKWNGFVTPAQPVALLKEIDQRKLKADALKFAAFGFESGLLSVRKMTVEEEEFVRVQLRRQPEYTPHPIKRTGYRPPLIMNQVREFARAHGTFTWRDLCPPLSRKTAQFACIRLLRRGEIEIVQRGCSGRNGSATSYRLSRGTVAGVAASTAPASKPSTRAAGSAARPSQP